MKVLRNYIVQNRITKEIQGTVADSFQEACEKLNWMVADCYYMGISETQNNNFRGETVRV